MNYQLLIESYSFGTPLNNQEIELLTIELETQLLNINISNSLCCLEFAPSHICKGLNLKKDSFWITCLAEVIDKHKPTKTGKTKGAQIYDELLKRGLVIG